MIDHRPHRALNDRACGLQSVAAEIGVADAVEDKIVRRQSCVRLGIFRHQDRRLELAIVEQRVSRNVAARGGDQEQDIYRRSLAAIRHQRQSLTFETPVAVDAGACHVAKRGQHIAHAAMRVDMAGIDSERRLEVLARRRLLADEEQKVAEIDAAIGIVRMVPHGFGEQRTRRRAVSGIEHERAEIVQRGEVVRLAAEELQIIVLGVLEAALLAQQTGAFGARTERIRIARQNLIELLQARTSRNTRRLASHDSLSHDS